MAGVPQSRLMQLDRLLGKMAVERGLVAQAQLKDALAEQARDAALRLAPQVGARSGQGASPRPLGAILVAKGYLTDAQLAALLEEQKARALDSDAARREDMLLGRLLIRQGHAAPEHVNECLRLQAEAIDGGEDRHPRLGEILVRKGYATAEAVGHALAAQQKTILACAACGKRYNVALFDPTKTYRCKDCQGALEPLASIDAIRVDDSAAFAPTAVLPRGATPPPSGAALPPGDPTQKLPTPAAPPFGKYTILRELGRGGMGVVYEAFDTALHRKVALKMMLSSANASAGERQLEEERFLREARLAANLPKHPHIVGVYDAGVLEGRRFLAMEFIQGRSITEWRRIGSVTARQQIALLRDVALAVHHAHEHGIIHRDLKPQNVLVGDKNQPHVTDFGLAKTLGQDVKLSLTGSGMVVGTPHYMSPEQAQGSKALDRRTDVWSLGVMLYEIVTGRLPFDGESAIDILTKVIRDPVPPPSRVGGASGPDAAGGRVQKPAPTLDPAIEAICLKALAKNADERYATAEALAADLTAWLQGGEVAVAAPREGRPAMAARKFPAWVRPAAAAAVVLGLSAWTFWPRGDSARRPEAEGARREADAKLEAMEERLKAEIEKARREAEQARAESAAKAKAEAAATTQEDRNRLAAERRALEQRVQVAQEAARKAGAERAKAVEVARKAEEEPRAEPGGRGLQAPTEGLGQQAAPTLPDDPAAREAARKRDAAVAKSAAPSAAPPSARTWRALYAGDFSADPAWKTDDGSSLRWDSATETFRGIQTNTLGTWALHELEGFNPNGTWRVELDFRIDSCAWSAGLTFGLFDDQMKYPNGAGMDLSIGDGGHCAGIWTTAQTPPGRRCGWLTATWYHAVIERDATNKILLLVITDKASGEVLTKQTIEGVDLPARATRLGVSRMHMKNTGAGASGSAAVDYHIDNVIARVEAAAERATLKALLLDPASLRPGLIAEYYGGMDFEQSALRKIDPQVAFGWGCNPPWAGGPVDYFSARWFGYLRAPRSGAYQFEALSDDGIRLSIDDVPVVSNWTDHSGKDTGECLLEQGFHKFVLEYYEDELEARISLSWKEAFGPLAGLIGSEYFYHDPAGFEAFQTEWRGGPYPAREELDVVLGPSPQYRGIGVRPASDGLYEATTRDGKPCVKLSPNKTGDAMRYLYFNVADGWAGAVGAVDVVVDYFDGPSGRLAVQYDSKDLAAAEGGSYKEARAVSLRGGGTWKTATFRLPDPSFSNRQNGFSDLRIASTPMDLLVHRVAVRGTLDAQRVATSSPPALPGGPTLRILPAERITVDGNPADWRLSDFTSPIRGGRAGAGDHALVGYDGGVLYYGGTYTGGRLPTNSADHTGKVYGRHDATSLYLLVRVDDSDIQTPEGASNNWANDCVEFYIDPGNNGGAFPIQNSDGAVQLVIDAANQKNVYMVSGNCAAKLLPAVTSAVTRDVAGWWLEVRISKSAFTPPLPASGAFGIDFVFRDQDGQGKTAAAASYSWSDFERSTGFPSKIPGRWGKANLTR